MTIIRSVSLSNASRSPSSTCAVVSRTNARSAVDVSSAASERWSSSLAIARVSDGVDEEVSAGRREQEDAAEEGSSPLARAATIASRAIATGTRGSTAGCIAPARRARRSADEIRLCSRGTGMARGLFEHAHVPVSLHGAGARCGPSRERRFRHANDVTRRGRERRRCLGGALRLSVISRGRGEPRRIEEGRGVWLRASRVIQRGTARTHDPVRLRVERGDSALDQGLGVASGKAPSPPSA